MDKTVCHNVCKNVSPDKHKSKLRCEMSHWKIPCHLNVLLFPCHLNVLLFLFKFNFQVGHGFTTFRCREGFMVQGLKVCIKMLLDLLLTEYLYHVSWWLLFMKLVSHEIKGLKVHCWMWRQEKQTCSLNVMGSCSAESHLRSTLLACVYVYLISTKRCLGLSLSQGYKVILWNFWITL